MKKEFLLLIAVLMLIVVACVFTSCGAQLPDTGGSSPTPPQEESPIGVIRKLSDEVQVDQTPIPGEGDLFDESEVGLFNGGEGLLDFGSALVLHLFNNTVLGGVEATTDPNSSLIVRLRLELGGFTGELNEAGEQATFETPNGARIIVMGTEFFLVYDQEEDTTTVGNFSGIVGVTAGGESVSLPSGYYLQVISDNPPGEPVEIPFTKTLFESRARELLSPVDGLGDLLSPTAVPTITPTPSPTSSPTATDTPSPTPTDTPTPTPPPIPPDLVVSSLQISGPGKFNTQGGFEVPIQVVVENQGETAGGNFKLSTEYSGPNGTFVVPFTVPGENDIWYPFINTSLPAGGRTTLNGKVTINPSAQGYTVSLRVIADSCSGDENMPGYCRVEENNEGNNASEQWEISVPVILYDFVDNANSAQWIGSNGILPFPGGVTDDDGFALWQYEAVLEDGERSDRVLETHPTWVDNGLIFGMYDLPDFIVEQGDRVVTRVGFLSGAGAGNVNFKMRFNYGSYATGCGEFGCTWEPSRSDSYDGRLLTWEFQLPKEMVGQRLNSVGLTVEAGSSSAQDWAVWEVARIERP